MTVHDRTAHAPDGAWSTSLVPRQQLVGTSEGAVSLLGSFGQRPRRSASDSQSVLCRLRRAHAALEALSRRRTQHRAPRQTSCGSSIRRSGAQSPTAPRRARVRERHEPLPPLARQGAPHPSCTKAAPPRFPAAASAAHQLRTHASSQSPTPPCASHAHASDAHVLPSLEEALVLLERRAVGVTRPPERGDPGEPRLLRRRLLPHEHESRDKRNLEHGAVDCLAKDDDVQILEALLPIDNVSESLESLNSIVGGWPADAATVTNAIAVGVGWLIGI
mmetsp:Transcript_36696/g.118634  ORF Transcript_36696/g.118634 Transcript_36696/m.118634 type:complete len:276 (-) Transcript_36696:609-1436(-)